MFLSHSSSFSTSLTFILFSQDLPRQSPHAGRHCNPLLKHEHSRVPQGFFENSLHSGAASKSVFTGSKPTSVVFHFHSNGFKQLASNSFHCATCNWTRKAWKKITLSVEARFSGFKGKDVVTASIKLAYLSDVRFSSDFPP